MKKYIFSIASILGIFSIVFGAFGAHAWEDYLISINKSDVFETAIKYQFYHVFFLMILGFGYDKFNQQFIKYSFYMTLIGVVLFSGSLYLLCLTSNSTFGIITPFGGLSLICAWLFFLFSLKDYVD